MPTLFHNGDDLPDVVLVERFQAGEFEVFDQLYHRHRDRIHNTISRVVRSPEDAHDISQEVFLRVYEGLADFKKASQFYTWVYRIAVNKCIDHKRKQSRHSALINEHFCDEMFCQERPHPLTGLESDEFYRQFDAALPVLTPCQRTVIVLRYKEHLPLKDIAIRLERSIGTVKAHLFQAHRTLREELLPYFEDGLSSITQD